MLSDPIYVTPSVACRDIATRAQRLQNMFSYVSRPDYSTTLQMLAAEEHADSFLNHLRLLIEEGLLAAGVSPDEGLDLRRLHSDHIRGLRGHLDTELWCRDTDALQRALADLSPSSMSSNAVLAWCASWFHEALTVPDLARRLQEDISHKPYKLTPTLTFPTLTFQP